MELKDIIGTRIIFSDNEDLARKQSAIIQKFIFSLGGRWQNGETQVLDYDEIYCIDINPDHKITYGRRSSRSHYDNDNSMVSIPYTNFYNMYILKDKPVNLLEL